MALVQYECGSCGLVSDELVRKPEEGARPCSECGAARRRRWAGAPAHHRSFFDEDRAFEVTGERFSSERAYREFSRREGYELD